MNYFHLYTIKNLGIHGGKNSALCYTMLYHAILYYTMLYYNSLYYIIDDIYSNFDEDNVRRTVVYRLPRYAYRNIK